jgi:hypothetical protein
MPRARRKTTDARKKITEMTRTATGFMTVITRTTTIGMTAKITLTEAIGAKGFRNIASTISKLAETRTTTGVGATSIRTMRKIERDRANTARVNARCLATERGTAMDWVHAALRREGESRETFA